MRLLGCGTCEAMPRIARVVVPGCPHHITQRGNRGEDVFVNDDQRRRYMDLLAKYAPEHGLAVQAYCLMSNHVHLIAVPDTEASLAATLRPVHLRYAQEFNRQMELSGHLWQGRFYSCPMNDLHFWAAVRYVERNPVRAGLVKRAEAYPWSSAAAHCGRRADGLLSGKLPALAAEVGIADWAAWLRDPDDEEMLKRLRLCTRTGRPAGDRRFIARLERRLGRRLRALAVGRPRKRPRKRGRRGR